MPKKLKLLFLTFTIILGVTSILLITNKKKTLDGQNGILNLIPDNFICIIKIYKSQNIEKVFIKDSVFIRGFFSEFNLLSINENFKIFNNNKKILNIKKPAYLSLHSEGKNNMSYIILLPLNQGYREKKVLKVFDNFQANAKYYDNVKFYELKDIKNKITSYLYQYNDYIFITNDKLLIEGVIRNKTSNAEKQYERLFLLSKSKNTLATLLLNFDNFYFLSNRIINRQYIDKILSAKKLGEYGIFDLNISNNLLFLNGFIIQKKERYDLTSVFNNRKINKYTHFNLIPWNADQIVFLGYNDINEFFSNLKQTRKKSGIEKYNNLKNKLLQNYLFDIDKNFVQNLTDEITLFFVNKTPYLLLRLKNFDEFKSKFLILTKKIKDNHDIKLIKINDDVYYIYEFGNSNFLENIFGDIFNCFSNLYFSFYEENIIFSDTYEALSQYLIDIYKNNSFFTFSSNQSIKKLIPSYSNFVYYVNFGRNKSINKYLISPSKNDNLFLCSNITYEDNILLTSIIFGIKDNSNLPQLSWKLKLDTTIRISPQIVKNHNTGEDEILVQDYYNNLYLINQSGNILWKKNIEEPVISKAYQIDYYKNNKLQILLNTPNYIYLIDRNGNYVENYPIKLPVKATNGLNVFDYENKKDYRIFIACDNKRVYAYDAKGKLVEGWKIPETEGYVLKEIQHFRIKTKDYICFNDSVNLYILDRRGNPRYNFKERLNFSDNQIWFFNSNEAQYITFTDISGKIYKVDFEKGYKSDMYRRFTSSHKFAANKFDCNDSYDYIFVDENQMLIYNEAGELIFNKEFNDRIMNLPVFLDFKENKTRLSGIKLENGDLYIIDCKGTILKGFPIKECENFNIWCFNNESNYFNIIVGKNDNFLYNYIVKF